MANKKEKGFINRAMLSQRLTGSPNNIRHDFVPGRFQNLMKELEDTIESIIHKHELNPEQKRQARAMSKVVRNIERR